VRRDAEARDPAEKLDLICGDFLTHPFAPGSFSMITSVAALHHMDPAAALARMDWLLQPGGTLVIVGLVRLQLPADLPWEAAAGIANLGYRLTRTYWETAVSHDLATATYLRRDTPPRRGVIAWGAVSPSSPVALLAPVDQA
jgi:SAM-dependent methyltransferase